MRILLTILLFVCLPCWLFAQATSGSTGLLNVPTAEMQVDGTFQFGANYLPENFTPDRFDYDTGNYYLNLTYFPFMEITYRCTLIKSNSSNEYTEQDRTFGLRLKLFKEKTYLPAIVLGGDDIFSDKNDGGKQSFGSTYLVSSKNFDWYNTKIGITLGAGIKSYNGEQVEGLFGGVTISPSFLKQVALIAEYDSNSVNLGASALLFNHLYLHAFVHDFDNLVGGLAYKIYLKK